MNLFDDEKDTADLRSAVSLFEAPSLTIRVANMVGSPIEWALKKLPDAASEKIHDAVHAALNKAVSAALLTMDGKASGKANTKTHSAVVAASGAVGGFFGLAGTLVELPVSTTIMMRSVADIARSEGFDVRSPAVHRECVQVFAMGGASKDDDAAESAYYALRTAFNEIAKEASKALAEIAAKHAAGQVASGVNVTSTQAGSVLAAMIQAVAKRFGITITEKFALQAAPVVGALSGATINTLFINHYQDMARGHFTVKRLEGKYGDGEVRRAYREVLDAKRDVGPAVSLN